MERVARDLFQRMDLRPKGGRYRDADAEDGELLAVVDPEGIAHRKWFSAEAALPTAAVLIHHPSGWVVLSWSKQENPRGFQAAATLARNRAGVAHLPYLYAIPYRYEQQ